MARHLSVTDTDQIIASSPILPSATAGTVSVWAATLHNSGSGDFMQFFQYADSGGSTDRLEVVRWTDNNVYIGWLNGGTDERLVLADTGLFTANQWINVIFNWNGSACAFYINAVQKTSGTATPVSSGLTTLSIGCVPAAEDFGSGSGAIGSIADFAMWNAALTAQEMASLAQGIRPNVIRPSALKAWYPLDGDKSPEPDLSGNAKNATISGTTKASGPPLTPQTIRGGI